MTRRLGAIGSLLTLSLCAGFGCMGSDSSNGGGGASTFQGSCDMHNLCDDWEGASAQALQQIQQACIAGQYSWTTGAACPTANRVGTCTLTSGGATYHRRVYTSWGATATQAAQYCVTGGFGSVGTWTAN